MKFAIGTFACTGVEAHLDPDLLSGLRVALEEYAQRLESGKPPIAIPRFRRDAVPSPAMVEFELPVDGRTLSALEREAKRQGATVSQLAAHAVLVCLAERDHLATAPTAA